VVTYAPYHSANVVVGSLTVSNTYNAIIHSHFFVLSGAGFTRLHSDQTTNLCLGNFIECDQPFTINPPQTDSMDLQIAKNLYLSGAGSINVTLTTPHAPYSFRAQCDPSSNLLYGSNTDMIVVISFGTPQPPPNNNSPK
jgi:hypothetical protein